MIRSVSFLVIWLATACMAHDTWVQPNTNIVRVGDAVYLDLMLGNHGNDHRDFKLAGKPSLEHSTWEVIAPDGSRHDLKPDAIDQGLGPKDGYFSARYIAGQPGLYLATQTSDQVVSYAPRRSVKSAKTFFVAARRLDEVPSDNPGFDRVLGHPLELVPLTHPVTPMRPGRSLKIRLLYKGRPLAAARVSCIPRGRKLAEGFDSKHERMTDADGVATFELDEANHVLLVAHHEDPSDQGPGYDATKYAATLTLYVPAVCPCCGE